MEERVKLALLEDMMDLDEGELNADTNLAELDSWDSMAKLSGTGSSLPAFAQWATPCQVWATSGSSPAA